MIKSIIDYDVGCSKLVFIVLGSIVGVWEITLADAWNV
jgi:hypothetical protein